jgi:hypothetical protein
MSYKDRTSIREHLASLDLGIDDIRAMQNMNNDRLKQIGSELVYVRKHWWLFPNWFWVVGLLGGGGCILYFHNLYALIGGLIVTCYCVGQLFFNIGFQDGYINGFESGQRSGVNTVLGITPEAENPLHPAKAPDP